MIHNKKPLIILDWDDTLYPTSTVIGDMPLPTKNIQLLDTKVSMLLKMCKSLNTNAVIVTNATKKWVLHHLKTMPKTSVLISQSNIFSARDLNVSNVANALLWKIPVFRKVYDMFRASELISIGDGYAEKVALSCINITTKKSVMFKKKPSFCTLIKEIEMMNITLKKVVVANKSISLVIT